MTQKNSTSDVAQRILAALTVLLPVLAVVVSWQNRRDPLPAELASHWSGNGPADESMETGTLLALSLALTGGPAIAALVAVFWRGMGSAVLRAVLGTCGAIAGMGAVIWLLSAALTMQAGSPQAVVLGWWTIVLILSLGFGVVPYFIAPNRALKPANMRQQQSFPRRKLVRGSKPSLRKFCSGSR